MTNEYGQTLDRNGYAPSLFEGEFCAICGKYGDLVRHEIYGGTRRSNSKKYGAWLTLCPRCHEAVHAEPKTYLLLKEVGQRSVMDYYRMTTEDFINKFGKNYLGD